MTPVSVVSDATIERLADKIAALINSKPHSPWRSEIVAVLRTEFPVTEPDGQWWIVGPLDGPLRLERGPFP